MKNKSSVMLFSAILILIFHLWIPVWQGNQVELFIMKTGYIGVDIFFLLSGYSLGKRELTNSFEFLKNRFKNVYLKFFIFVVVGLIYNQWSLSYFIEVISGLNLFKHGGGAFLWFLPAIMLFYICFCLFKKLESKSNLVSFVVLVVIWGSLLLIINTFSFKQCSIFINRVPVFMIGYYLCRFKVLEKLDDWKYWLTSGVVSGLGFFLVYKFGFLRPLNKPFQDMFYFTAIPLTVGLVLLLSRLPKLKLMNILGRCTLEMYAIQMIFGYKFAMQMTKLLDNKLLMNISSFVFVIFVSFVVNKVFQVIWGSLFKAGI